MALKPPRKAAVNKTEEGVAVNIRIEPTSDTDAIYANHIEIAHNLHEFTLSFTRIPARFPLDVIENGRITGAIVVEPKILIMLPPTLITPLIKALQAQRYRYEEDIDKDNEKASQE